MAMDMNALLAAASKKVEAKRKDFEPLELNEGNVQAIFNRCLAKPDYAGIKSYAQVFKMTLAGQESSERIFMKRSIKENSKHITYLFGQLKSVHIHEAHIPFEYGIVTYGDKHWTKQTEMLFMLYELGISNGNIHPFVAQDDDKELFLTNITGLVPTISPKDPNFPAWWEEHRGEWEG